MSNKLSPKQQAFCEYYLESSNATQAAIKAGYSEKGVRVTASHLLTNINIQEEISRLREEMHNENIASAQEVMEYFSKVMRGEIKDQFGLDAPLSERTKAAQELAKRTVDLDNRAQGKATDAVVQIKLDWSRDEEGSE